MDYEQMYLDIVSGVLSKEDFVANMDQHEYRQYDMGEGSGYERGYRDGTDEGYDNGYSEGIDAATSDPDRY